MFTTASFESVFFVDIAQVMLHNYVVAAIYCFAFLQYSSSLSSDLDSEDESVSSYEGDESIQSTVAPTVKPLFSLTSPPWSSCEHYYSPKDPQDGM